MATLNKFFFFKIILLFYIKTYSQDFNKIKEADTIYIIFKKEPYKQIYLAQKKGFGDYYFNFDKFYEFKQIIFYHNPKAAEEKKLNKSFLKKHKDVLVNYNYLVNMYNYQNAKELLLNKKKIYLIDYNDIGWFTIKLREVKISNVNLNPIE
ncbi:hypothetical protein [Flavobacterium polysaccharolyticum]|uniref:Uncharacterized protein n=1 Tax=Flavobacterium polysaccharolyticum TaxID=3133148 RepID=A0ABU9NSM9_9FLAO